MNSAYTIRLDNKLFGYPAIQKLISSKSYPHHCLLQINSFNLILNVKPVTVMLQYAIVICKLCHLFQLTANEATGIPCKFMVVMMHYFTLTNFFWMLVEGLYVMYCASLLSIEFDTSNNEHGILSFIWLAYD